MESTLGKGSTFQMEIPTRAQFHILVVEDQEDLRGVLRDRGATAVVARGTATTSSARKKYLQYLADLLQRRTTFSLVPTSKPEHMQQHEQTEAELTRSARRP